MLFGSLWILGSDWVVELVTGGNRLFPGSPRVAQTLKGFFFVGLTSSLLWTLIARHSAKLQQTNDETLAREQSWRRMLENLPVPFCVITDNQISYANTSALATLGPSPSVLGREFTAFITDEDRPTFQQALRSFISSHPTPIELKMIHLRDVAGRTLECQIMLSHSAVVSGSVDVTILDFTERNRLAALAQMAERQQVAASIAAGVAHDFNNAFAAILGQANLARMHKDLSEETDNALRLIEQVSSETAGLTRSLLAFARVPGPDHRVRPLMPVMNSLRQLSRGVLPKTVTLAFELHDLAGLHAKLDEGAFLRALLNVVSNANDATASRPAGNRHVRIEAMKVAGQSEHGDLRIVIEDNGEGIAPENLSRLFSAFFTTKPVGKGTGLGLVLTKSTIEELGGGISVSSRLDHGTQFIITIPLCAAPRIATLPTRASRTVLVADANELVRGAVASMLRSAGYKAIECAEGSQVLDLWRDGLRPQLAILNLALPGVDGLACVRQIRQDEVATRSDRMPILLTSSGAFPELEPNLRHRMFLLSKPFSQSELLAIVESVLSVAA